jgi:RHS repeat-associated protein
VVTNSSGTVCFDADYYPFGAEIQEYTDSCTPTNKFTGKERDPASEGGNDNFGARYYMSDFGRFTNPDPGNVGAHPLVPQSWNAYAYSDNNPLSRIDSDGRASHCVDDDRGGDGGQKCTDDGDDQAQNTNAAVQVAKDTVVGAGKEAVNTIIGLSNGVNSLLNSALGLTGSSFSFGQTPELQASTPGESSAMLGTSVALLVVGGPELKSADAIAFGKSLASEGQIAETGTAIAGSGSSVAFRDSGRLAATYGGNAADWSKMTSSAYRAGDGSVVSTHWYENTANAMRVEYKSIIDKAPWLKK